MREQKQTKVYNFSVEGETEQWYLHRVEELLNTSGKFTYKVSLKSTVAKNPLKYSKKVNSLMISSICHVCDVEGQSSEDIGAFEQTLRNLGEAQKKRGITYSLAYSNYAFELWIIFHKLDCYGSLGAKGDYLTYINRAFNTNYQSLDEYKEEKNFRHCLAQISLEDVKEAIRRAEHVIKQKQTSGEREICYGKYKYYRSNPALSIHLILKQILEACL